MPMHNWKRVPATIYHHFHQQWTIAICDALNAGMLPEGYSAFAEQYSSGLYLDALTLQRPSAKPSRSRKETITLAPPRTRMVVQPREGRFHERANRITIRHHLGEVVSVIEVLSPGNKNGKIADMPAWLDPDLYVNVPLEKTYVAAWEVCPADFKYFVEHGAPPEENPISAN
jgi:hypothetical protein